MSDCDQLKYKLEQEKKTRQIVKDFSDLANNLANDDNAIADTFCDEFNRTHRTLQQGIAKLLYLFIAKASKTEYSDARNEATIEWFKKVAEIEQYFPLI